MIFVSVNLSNCFSVILNSLFNTFNRYSHGSSINGEYLGITLEKLPITSGSACTASYKNSE